MHTQLLSSLAVFFSRKDRQDSCSSMYEVPFIVMDIVVTAKQKALNKKNVQLTPSKRTDIGILKMLSDNSKAIFVITRPNYRDL